MPREQDAKTSPDQPALYPIESQPLEIPVRGHHAPDLAGIVPGEIPAPHREEEQDQQVGGRGGDQGDRHDRHEDERHSDRGPLVTQDHLPAPVDDPVGGHEMRVIDQYLGPGKPGNADEAQIPPAGKQQGDEHDD